MAPAAALAIDLAALWDFSQPLVSEQRFRQALAQATGDDALILQTQIARSFGLRKDFNTARRLLAQVEPAMVTAGPEARVRFHLEMGRSRASAAHRPEVPSAEDKALARASFETALREAQAAGLDGLAIDAVHMFAFLDTAPEQQLKWARAALAIVQASTQPEARRWEASVHNNLGHALHQLERHAEALEQFQQALALRERGGNAEATRVARWMVARSLRKLQRLDDALAIQLRLDRDMTAAAAPDPYVLEELEALYLAKGRPEEAAQYTRRKMELGKPR